MNYAREHLRRAVSVLVTDKGPIKDRLRDAVNPLLDARMNFTEIPAPLQPEYEALCGELTAVGDPKRGSIAATVDGLSDEDASEFAARILRLFLDFIRPPD